MKDNWEKLLGGKPSDDFRSRVLNSAAPILEERAARGQRSWLEWWVLPLSATGGLALAALAVVLLQNGGPGRSPEELRLLSQDPAMVRDAQMLLDLEDLETWIQVDKAVKAKKWPKKKG